jgi:hypothetical protein
MGASGAQATGYTIDQSIRFNDDDSAYMSKTFSSASNRKTWTWSGWCKRGLITDSDNGNMFCTYGGGAAFSGIRWETATQNDTIFIFDYTGSGFNYQLHTTQVFRDPSAWYHIVFAFDSTQSVSSERARLYINGQRVTDFRTESYPTLNYDSYTNNNQLTVIGASNSGSYNEHLDGYLAEIHFLDGYAYGPEYFGEFEENGIWIPKEYDGSYGTNGFKIDGRDSSDLGDDESGNGNDFSASGLQANDQRADSPTNNHVTFNPVAPYIDGATMTFKNGNLDVSNASGAWGSSQTTMGIPGSGKWTFAVKLTNSLGGSSYPMFGIIDSSNQPNTDGVALPYQSGTPANSMVYVNTYQDSTQAYFFKGGGGSESTIGSAFSHGGATSGEWQWFINSDDKELTVYHNGTKRLDAYDISFLTFPVFMAATLYDYDDLRLLNEPGTEYTPSISGYKAINSKNIGS